MRRVLRSSRYLCVAFSLLFSAATASAQSHEDSAALAALDATFQKAVDINAENSTKSLALIHKVVDRIATSFIEPFSVRELANYANSALRPYADEGGGAPPDILAQVAIDALIARLGDPFASFTERKMRPRGKRSAGIGVEVTVIDGALRVIAPLDGSPAQKSGVKPGDVILEIDREPIYSVTVSEALRRLRGPIGTEVLLRIQRGGARKYGIPVPRQRFRPRALRHELLGDIAYLRIAFFGPKTERLLRKSLAAIRKARGGREPDGYVVDLRNNPGGLVGQAILIADAFLEDGMIVKTTGREAKGARQYKAYRGDFINGRPIVILQNQASASASEILAAALKDHQRATIMGTRSYGKGIVQTVYPFGASGQIRFTTHKYMTAAGIPIHGVGVLPDVVVNGDPRPKYGAAAVPIGRCPKFGAAGDRTLGCAVLLLKHGGKIAPFMSALSGNK